MNLIKKWMCVCCLLGGLAFHTQAQTATINNDLVITVEDQTRNGEAGTQYVIDISNLNLTQAKATQLFQKASNHNVVNFTPDFNNQTVTMDLALNKVPAYNRTVTNVNKYLNYLSNSFRNFL